MSGSYRLCQCCFARRCHIWSALATCCCRLSGSRGFSCVYVWGISLCLPLSCSFSLPPSIHPSHCHLRGSVGPWFVKPIEICSTCSAPAGPRALGAPCLLVKPQRMRKFLGQSKEDICHEMSRNKLCIVLCGLGNWGLGLGWGCEIDVEWMPDVRAVLAACVVRPAHRSFAQADIS